MAAPKPIYQEENWTRALITIDNLPEHYQHLEVGHHSKIRNMLGFAIKSFKTSDHILISASGPSVNKAITCGEIFKRQFPQIKQVTGIGYRNVRMITEEMINGEISKTITTRRLPSIHILLSKNHLHPNLPAYNNHVRYQGADKVSDHVTRPVSRKTFNKSEYRGTKENQLMSL
ncbi:Hypothetical protein CINCED_3A011371 [Cinara cedri]|uniref:DNA/RNA-binding protein Alba-like domain-containing protein n=1 Tax=Cinara cedri TaxID=506608 RepID=A0A5E4MMJ4_9HEMI|nr:Hypothetical protein CINCED_3A011371 [Cinara cedri]